jgi:hypothetical protein
MPEDSLISQLSNRAKLFHPNTNISQAMMAETINFLAMAALTGSRRAGLLPN